MQLHEIYKMLRQYKFQKFAEKLNKDLQEISHDKHLRLQYTSSIIPVDKHIYSIKEITSNA